jgi:26S proteasome regulatory subunit N12
MGDLSAQIGQLSKHISSSNLEAASTTFEAIKSSLIRLPSMPPSATRDPGELNLIKEAFEQGAFLAVLRKDSQAFENSVQMLKILYKDFDVQSDK